MFKRAVVVAAVLTATSVFAQSPATVPEPPHGDTTVAPIPASPAAEIPTFGSIFRELSRDFRRLPSRETAAILGVGGALSLAVRPEDQDLTRRAASSPPLDAAFDAGEVIGGGLAQFGVALGTYALGRAKHSARVAQFGADLVRAQLVNTVITHGIKLAVGRDRPDGGRYSFPSGHTSAAFATATVIQRHFGWKAGIPSYGLASYVAASRLPENKHYTSDLLFGAAVGIVSGRCVSVGHGRTQFAVAPFAAPGGGGLSLTLLDAP